MSRRCQHGTTLVWAHRHDHPRQRRRRFHQRTPGDCKAAAAVSKVRGNCMCMPVANVCARGSMSPHDYDRLLTTTHAHPWIHLSAHTQAPYACVYASMHAHKNTITHAERTNPCTYTTNTIRHTCMQKHTCTHAHIHYRQHKCRHAHTPRLRQTDR